MHLSRQVTAVFHMLEIIIVMVTGSTEAQVFV